MNKMASRQLVRRYFVIGILRRDATFYVSEAQRSTSKLGAMEKVRGGCSGEKSS